MPNPGKRHARSAFGTHESLPGDAIPAYAVAIMPPQIK